VSFSIFAFMTSSAGRRRWSRDERSGIGSVGHGGDIGRLKNEEAGGGGAGSARSYEDDDGDRGRLDFSDDFAGGVEQAAGVLISMSRAAA